MNFDEIKDSKEVPCFWGQFVTSLNCLFHKKWGSFFGLDLLNDVTVDVDQ